MNRSHTHAVSSRQSNGLMALLLGAAIVCASMSTARADLAANVQVTVDSYKKQLVEWAASPVAIAAAKESNAKGGTAGMTNAKWSGLGEDDPAVKALQSGATAKQVGKWETYSEELGKLNLRDEAGNLVAFGPSAAKPAFYNNSDKPPYKNGMKGPWSDKDIKPDLTTKKNSVQIAAPIMDGGKAIGLIHASVEIR